MSLVNSSAKMNRGDGALDFRLLGVDGKHYSLADFSSYEGLLVVFMCNHCPYVKIKIGALKNLYDEFGDRVTIVGINSNDSEYTGEGMDNMKKFTEEYNIEFPYLMDDTQEVARAYDATCTPDPFLFDKDRKLAFHGRINDAMGPDDVASEDTMRENIGRLISGEEIEKWFNPSAGCSIKWK
jgi:peroxiredoxin